MPPRENCGIELLFQLRAGIGEDQTASRAPKCFMGRSGNHICVRKRIWIKTCSNQTRDVSHINEKISPDFVSDFAKAREIQSL
ncbi:hypothetical protein D3C87_1494520 [compost metagenome]